MDTTQSDETKIKKKSFLKNPKIEFSGILNLILPNGKKSLLLVTVHKYILLSWL